jgi:cyclophilin family peptidyl-prolyl cis-trans isomerase
MLSWHRPRPRLSRKPLHRLPRFRPAVEGLEERCLLAAPVIDTIAPQNVPAGKTLIVPVTATSPDGSALTYTVTSSNSAQVTAVAHTSNTFLKLTVQEQQTDGTFKPFADTADQSTLIFQLFNDLTPKTVAAITNLVNSGFYNNVTFHRIVPSFVIQGGDPTGTGSGGPGFTFPNEFNLDAIFDGNGQLAMANAGKDNTTGADTNGSQFFVTVGQQRTLDFNHTIFGQLLRGFEVLTKVNQVPTTGQKPNLPVVITNASIFTDTTDTILTIHASSAGAVLPQADITVTAKNAAGETSSQTFHVTAVTDQTNDPAVLSPVTNQTTPMNTPVNFNLSGVDLENDALTFEALPKDPTPHATIAVNGNVVTVTPNPGFVGPIHLVVGVKDQGATSRGSVSDPFDTEPITVNVTSASQTATTTTVTADHTSSVIGQSVTFTATVAATGTTGTPSGTVQFQIDGNNAGNPVTLTNGVATFSTSLLTVGSHTINAIYSGDSNFSVSSGNVQVTVDQASTTTAITANPTSAASGQSVTLTATVTVNSPGSGTPSGTVTFQDGSTTLGTANVNTSGRAVLTVPSLAVGSHNILASYGGETRFGTSSSTATLVTVAKGTPSIKLTSSANPVTIGNPVTLTATVTAAASGSVTPTGSVTFLEGGKPLQTVPLANGVATWTTTGLGEGSHTITASYSGDANFAAATTTLAQVVNPVGMTNESFVVRLYQTVLGRQIDTATRDQVVGWLDRGQMTRAAVAAAVVNSPEAHALQVQNLYQQVLRRAPDAAGLANSLALLNSGASITMLRAVLMSSGEYFQTQGNGTNDGWITAVYRDVLNRTADTDGRNAHNGLLTQGVSRLVVAFGILNNDLEPRTVQVQNTYQQVLHRPGDSVGVSAAVAALLPHKGAMTDQQFETFLLASNEFFNEM